MLGNSCLWVLVACIQEHNTEACSTERGNIAADNIAADNNDHRGADIDDNKVADLLSHVEEDNSIQDILRSRTFLKFIKKKLILNFEIWNFEKTGGGKNFELNLN